MGNYHAFAWEHGKYFHFLPSPLTGILLTKTNAALCLHFFFALFFACLMIIIFIKKTIIYLQQIKAQAQMHLAILLTFSLSSFISSLNATLLSRLVEIFSADHGPFLLSFPLPDSFHSLFCHFSVLCFTFPLTPVKNHKAFLFVRFHTPSPPHNPAGRCHNAIFSRSAHFILYVLC